MFGFGGDGKSEEKAEAPQAPAAAPAEAPASSGESGDPKVGSMPSGDYTIHIHLQTGKNFSLPDEDTVDPYVRIEALGVEGSSKTHNDVSATASVNFNEHIFLSLKKIDNEDAQDGNIKITVLNKGFFKGDVIGQTQLSLSKVYDMSNHVMMHQTLGLTDPNGDDFSKMSGSLVVSINVQGPGDEATELKMGTAKEIDEKPIIMPSSVKKRYKQLYFRVYMAQHLPKMDTQLIGTGTIDAFLVVSYKGKKLKTITIKQEDQQVGWFYEFLIPIEIPVVKNKITLQVYDEDAMTNDLAATTFLQVKNMIKYDTSNPNVKPQMKWINLYGAPVGRSGSNTGKMNNNPECASTWKGRILVEYHCEDFKYPVYAARPFTPSGDQMAKFNQQMAQREFYIIGEFGSGMCLPRKKQYKMAFSIGEHKMKSNKPKNSKEDWCRWDDRFGNQVFSMPYGDGKYCPTFYIYLVDDDDCEVCFFRDSLLDYKDKNGPLHWRNFEPDLSHGKCTDEQKAGYFSFRLYFHELGKEGPFDPMKIPSWKKPPPTRLTPYKARVAIYQCENLPPSDKSGNSDPYVEVYDPQEPGIKTETCHDTNNPIFYEVKEFRFSCYSNRGEIDLYTAPPMILNIWDHDDDITDSTDDLIGRAVINLAEVEQTQDDVPHISFTDEIPYPAWFPVRRNYDDEYDLETGASILVSIQIKELDDQFALPANVIELNKPPPLVQGRPLKMPDLHVNEFKCEITVLGLRDLVSTGLMPVNKAFIKFSVKSLLPVQQANAIENVFTEPSDRGSDPIIRTTVQFEVQMPFDPTFLPRMTCEVYDQLFIGAVGQPQIGTFTLKLGDIVTDMKEKMEYQKEKAKNLKNTVEQILQRIQGSGLDSRLRAREVANAFSSLQDPAEQPLSQTEQIGQAMLKRFELEGMKVPPTTGLKKPKKQGRKIVIASDESKALLPTKKQKEESLKKIETGEQFDQMSKKTKSEQKSDIKKAVGTNMRKKVQYAFEADLAMKKRELEAARKEDQKMVGDRKGAYGNRIEPIYKLDDRLKIDREPKNTIPPSSLFKAIGFNKTRADGIKHYRRYYPDELENVKDSYGAPIINSPFIKESIFRAKPVKQSGFLGGLFGGDSGSEFVAINAGHFKGSVRCFTEKERQNEEQELKDELFQLMEKVCEVYEKDRRTKVPLNPNVVYQIDDMDDDQRVETLENIRQVIEDAGLEKLNIFALIDDLAFQASLLNRLNEVQKCMIKLYMVEGFNFARRDLFSESDPFLKVICGKHKFDEQKNYQLDTAEPKFNKCYQFQADFPGSPILKIEAYDYDDLFGDDLIGVTRIDLDDRFYSQSWLAIEDKPIEYRDLFCPSSTNTQGVVKLWIEIDDVDSAAGNSPPININPEPVLDFWCRVVVWKTRDIEMMDVEGTSDVFIRAYFESNNDKKTDTHWRCQNGEASFNYRLLFPVKSQRPNYNLTIQAWDKDIIMSNDIIGEVQLPIDYLVEDAVLTNKSQYINSKYFDDHMREQLQQMNNPLAEDIKFDDREQDRFWVPVHRKIPDADKTVHAGDVMVSICLIPKDQAEKDPQGEGRQEPNNDPFCPPPEGRVSLSLNPFKMFEQFVGPEIRRKIYCMLITVACCFLLAMMAPMIFSNLITRGLFG